MRGRLFTHDAQETRKPGKISQPAIWTELDQFNGHRIGKDCHHQSPIVCGAERFLKLELQFGADFVFLFSMSQHCYFPLFGRSTGGL